MKNRLYIYNLNLDTTADQLKELFQQAGNVEMVNILYSSSSKRPKGCAFVDMEDDAQASVAMEKLNNQVFLDRQIKVSISHSLQPRQDRGGYAGD